MVWSEPVSVLSSRFGLSDVGFAKICRRARIPLPPRGYWAKRSSGKPVAQIPFPDRGPGMADLVEIEPRVRRTQVIAGSTLTAEPEVAPPPPPLPPAIKQLLEETRTAIGRVPVTRDLATPHTLIAAALAKDEVRRQKMLRDSYAWDKPILDSPMEKRRLRLLQSLFLALERQHCKPSMHAKNAREVSARVGDVWVAFSIDSAKAEADREPRRFRGQRRPDCEQLKLQIDLQTDYSFQTLWCDVKESPLESHLKEIASHLIVSSEILLEQAKKRNEEWDRWQAERDFEDKRRAVLKIERERVRQLYRDARNWHRAERLRNYIAAVTPGTPIWADDFNRWKSWALAEANRVDPLMAEPRVTSGSESESFEPE
ncbi:MAG TPA: hypothetical protein VGL17_00570 [Gemmatimonadaceae bacterium]